MVTYCKEHTIAVTAGTLLRGRSPYSKGGTSKRENERTMVMNINFKQNINRNNIK